VRAVRFARLGAAAEVLEVDAAEAPRAGAGQALVRMRLAAVNPADLLLTQGRYGRPPALPAVPGVEGVGTVEALGPGVAGPAVGTRVALQGHIGTWQEILACDARCLLPVPLDVPDAAAAQFANPFSAAVMLEDALTLAPGAWIAQSAAASALGRAIVQMARAKGCRTVNLVRRAEQADELKAIGAEHVIVGGEDVPARIRAIVGEAGVAAALDAVGGQTGTDLVKALAPGGTLLVHGVLDGRPIEVHPGWLLAKEAAVRGFWVSRWLERAAPERRAAVATEVFRLLADGALSLPVDATYPLEAVREAVAHAERSGRHGKVLLTMEGPG